jgi:YfiH family protein
MDNYKSLIQYKIFESHKNIVAFTTIKDSLGIQNVRFSDLPENKLKLAEVLGIRTESLVFPKQTHTNCVAEISSMPVTKLDETDALITNKPGLCICVQTADCVPILLFDPIKNVVSAIHAGWRGTVGKIVEVAVRKMISNYDSLPQNIVAAIGPSISSQVYEVGNEVAEAARNSIPNVELTLHKNNSDRFYFNLWEANRQLLLACGLQTGNIEVLGECSFLEKEKFYSARRDGMNTGRMVSGIMLR